MILPTRGACYLLLSLIYEYVKKLSKFILRLTQFIVMVSVGTNKYHSDPLIKKVCEPLLYAGTQLHMHHTEKSFCSY